MQAEGVCGVQWGHGTFEDTLYIGQHNIFSLVELSDESRPRSSSAYGSDAGDELGLGIEAMGRFSENESSQRFRARGDGGAFEDQPSPRGRSAGIYIYIYVCIFICIYACIHIHIRVWSLGCMQIYMPVCLCIYIYVHTYTRIYKCMYMYTHTYMYIYKHIHCVCICVSHT
jgi:hypothetical protein